MDYQERLQTDFQYEKKKMQKFNLIVCLDPLRALLLGKKYTIFPTGNKYALEN